MIIGVMSDTHGHLTEMRRAAVMMVERFRVDLIIHLGDDSTDADELTGLGPDLIFVPGTFEERYRNPAIPNRIIREIEGVPFLLTHTPIRDPHDLPDDIDPTTAAVDGDAKVVLHGHTHRWRVEEIHGAIYINPGHMKLNDRDNNHPTFAVLDLKAQKLHVRIVDLAGEEILEKTFFIEIS